MALSHFYKRLSLLFLGCIISFIQLTLCQDSSEDNTILKNPVSEAPIQPFRDNALNGDKAAQAATMFFLCLAALDYVIYFALFFYVFLFVVFESKSVLKFMFSMLVLLLFTGIRLFFVPLIINGIPYSWAPILPPKLMEVSFYACTVSYIVFFNLPVIASLYYIVKFGFRGEKLKGGIIDPTSEQVPMVVVMMPIYNEEPIPLFRAVESAIRSDYPHDRLHLLLAFDDATESSLYWSLLKKLKVLNKDVHQQWKREISEAGLENQEEVFLFPPRLELIVEGVRITICRFPHEGKSATQGKGFQIVDDLYGKSEPSASNTLLMYIDSDVILHDNAIYNFVNTMVHHPRMNAVTGYVTCRTSDSPNIFHYLQDAEYLEGQMFARSLEALAGSVTCLPGALTMLRLKSMQAVAPKYFRDFNKKRPLHFHRFYLGEDRFMTHLLMEESDRAYTIGLCGASRCKTDAPDNWQKLIKQRRRWYLGALINEAHMLCTPKLWKTFPLLLSLKLFDYSSGSLSWLFMVYVIGAIKGVVPIWTICVFFPCLILKYLLLSINASFMNRYKVSVSFPIFFFISPIFKMWCTVYSVFTWDTRSWGGPRTDVTENKVSNVEVMDGLMRQRHTSMKRSKKMVRQMKQRAKIMNRNIIEQSTISNIQTQNKVANINEKAEDGAMPLKKILPFPFEVDILGGGEYFTGLIYPDMISNRLLNSDTNTPSLSPIPSVFDMNLTQTSSSCSLDIDGSRAIPAIDTQKYIYGKIHKENPSQSTLSLDLSSLTRMERLSRVKADLDSNPSSFSYRLSSFQDGSTILRINSPASIPPSGLAQNDLHSSSFGSSLNVSTPPQSPNLSSSGSTSGSSINSSRSPTPLPR